jgi:hypothetical protein
MIGPVFVENGSFQLGLFLRGVARGAESDAATRTGVTDQDAFSTLSRSHRVKHS